jgi:hypothetical protein
MWREASGVDDLALMEVRVAALFKHDAAGRIVTTNEPEPDPGRAPRLFLGRTAAGNVWRFRDDLPDQIVVRLQPLLAAEPPWRSDNPRQPPATFAALCDALAAGGTLGEVWQGPAWQFPATIPSPQGVVIVGSDNRDLLRQYFPYAAEHLQARQPPRRESIRWRRSAAAATPGAWSPPGPSPCAPVAGYLSTAPIGTIWLRKPWRANSGLSSMEWICHSDSG